jgi:hypothetical protein
MAADAVGETDEVLGECALGLVALVAQRGEPGKGAGDFAADFFGFAQFGLKFVGTHACELGIGRQVAPSAQEVAGTGDDVMVPELLHVMRVGWIVGGRAHDAMPGRWCAMRKWKKYGPVASGPNFHCLCATQERPKFDPGACGPNFQSICAMHDDRKSGPGVSGPNFGCL